MERKIGEIFECNGEWYQCLTGYCKDCAFLESKDYCKDLHRKDICTANLIFKKLEKVGEPYDFQKRTFQTYKLHTIPFLSEGVELVAIPSKDNNTIEIEIKQTKEDMEEKNDNALLQEQINHLSALIEIATSGREIEHFKQEMNWLIELQHYRGENNAKTKFTSKPFDLEAAKAGKPVCTRDGRKARIICFDAKGDKPIIALIEMGVAETPNNYPIDGKAISTKETPCDLMMLPEKKEGWVNVDKCSNGGVIISKPYPTRDEAIHNSTELTIDMVILSWNE